MSRTGPRPFPIGVDSLQKSSQFGDITVGDEFDAPFMLNHLHVLSGTQTHGLPDWARDNDLKFRRQNDCRHDTDSIDQITGYNRLIDQGLSSGLGNRWIEGATGIPACRRVVGRRRPRLAAAGDLNRQGRQNGECVSGGWCRSSSSSFSSTPCCFAARRGRLRPTCALAHPRHP